MDTQDILKAFGVGNCETCPTKTSHSFHDELINTVPFAQLKPIQRLFADLNHQRAE